MLPCNGGTIVRYAISTVCTFAGIGDHLLEEFEPSSHLEGLLQLMPTVEQMSARLRPKLIQDPFLDHKGKPYTYAGLCRWVWSW